MAALEQRLTGRLMTYWDVVRKSNKIPEITQFNIDPVKDLWDHCFMVSVDTRNGTHYRYEYVGDLITETYGEDMTGRELSTKAQQFPGALIYNKLNEIARGQAPTEDNGHFMTGSGKMIKYRACFLPFGSEKRGLTHIVVGLSFRQF